MVDALNQVNKVFNHAGILQSTSLCTGYFSQYSISPADGCGWDETPSLACS
jgi:hypothetical protein